MNNQKKIRAGDSPLPASFLSECQPGKSFAYIKLSQLCTLNVFVIRGPILSDQCHICVICRLLLDSEMNR